MMPPAQGGSLLFVTCPKNKSVFKPKNSLNVFTDGLTDTILGLWSPHGIHKKLEILCMHERITDKQPKNFTITRKMGTVLEYKMLVAILEKTPLESTLQQL